MNEIDRWKTKLRGGGGSVTVCHLIRHKIHMTWSGKKEHEPPWWESTTNSLSHGRAIDDYKANFMRFSSYRTENTVCFH